MSSRDQEDLVAAIDDGKEAGVLHTPCHRQRLGDPCGRLAGLEARAFPLLVLTLLCAPLSGAPGAGEGPGSSRPNARFDATQAALILEAAIDQRAFPGCAVAVGTRGEVLWRGAFGRLDHEGGPAVRTDTLYDLASLTKVIGTTSVILTLVRDGQLSLDDPVTRAFPELTIEGSDSITIEHLLTHSSGLPAWKPLYKETAGYENVLRRVIETPLEAAPGTRYRYSDLGFLLLGELAARVAKKPLAELERERVLGPLGMTTTLRNPDASLRPRIAPTERIPAAASSESGDQGTRYVHGVVHDENARAAGGLTGHAGLFSTVEDLSLFAAELLRGLAGESEVFPAELLEVFTARSHVLADSSRALGWGMKTRGGSAGSRMTDASFGHTGFTGTSMWIDPRRGMYVILLTNRVHPSRDDNRIRTVRRELADAVTAAFDRWEAAGDGGRSSAR